MVSSLDRSKRQASNKRRDAAKERRKQNEEKKAAASERRSRKQTRKEYRRSSAAHYESKSLWRTVFYSAGVLIIAFIFFEVLLLICESFIDDIQNHDLYWHLINIADTCAGFIIGLTAMDALTYINQGKKAQRDEERAIIRHNRIIKPSIDMYLARKNGLITPSGEEAKHFQVVTSSQLHDLRDMYGPSEVMSDAGMVKIEAFKYYMKKLEVSFLNMAEDINFDFNPEVCDAVMDFLNESTYGRAALDAVISYNKEGNRTQKMSIIRQVKEAPDNIELGEIQTDELKTAYIVMRMIHAQEDALEKYLKAVEELDDDNAHRKSIL